MPAQSYSAFNRNGTLVKDTSSTRQTIRSELGLAEANVLHYADSGSITPDQVKDGTTDARAVIAAADAVGDQILFPPGTYRVASDITLASPCRFAPGAVVKPDSGIEVKFDAEVQCGLSQCFDVSAGGKCRMRHWKQTTVYPEWWGAVTLPDPDGGTMSAGFGGGIVDSTDAINAAINDWQETPNYPTPATAGGRIAATMFFSGWYGISDEIQMRKFAVNITGHNPMYFGSGLMWIGALTSGVTNSKGMIRISGSGWQTIERIGLIAKPTNDLSERLLACIIFDHDGGNEDTQRNIKIDSIVTNDSVGHHTIGNYLGGVRFYTKHGILFTGTHANNDFHEIRNSDFTKHEDCIHNTSGQSVQHRIKNCKALTCNTFYHSSANAGDVTFDGIYLSQRTYEAGFKFAGNGTSHHTVNVKNLSMEHLKGRAIVSCPTGDGIRILLESSAFIQFSDDFDYGSVTQSGTSLTSTTDFFTKAMEGRVLKWKSGADTGREVEILSVEDTMSATTIAGDTGTAAQGDVIVLEKKAQGTEDKHVYIFDSSGWVEAMICNARFNTTTFGGQAYYAASVPWRNRNTISTSHFGSRYTYFNCVNPHTINHYVGTFNYINDSTMDIRYFGCSAHDNDVQRIPDLRRGISGRSGGNDVDADGYFLGTNMRDQNVFSVGADDLRLGLEQGGHTFGIKTEVHRVRSTASRKLVVPGFWKKGRVYLGCMLHITDSNIFGHYNNSYSRLRAGTPDNIDLVPPINASESVAAINADSHNGSGAMTPTAFATDTDLVIEEWTYGGTGSRTAASTAFIASATSIVFTAARSDTGGLLRMIDGADAGTFIKILSRTSDTEVETDGSTAIASGQYEWRDVMRAGGDLVVQTYYVEGFVSTSNFDKLKFDALAAETEISYPNLVADASVQGHWRLDDDAANTTIVDSSANANNGTLNGGKNTDTATTTGPTNLLTKALSFDGASDYINLNDILDSTFAGTGEKFSIACWIKPGVNNMTNNMIIGKVGTGTNEREFFLRLTTDSKAEFLWYGSSGTSTPYFGRSSATAITDTTRWYHIIATYDDSQSNINNACKIYVDGVDDTSGTIANGTPDFIGDLPGSLEIGSYFGGSLLFNGDIAEMIIFDKVLAGNEIDILSGGV